MSQGVAVCGKLKPIGEGVGKPSPNRAIQSHAADAKRNDLSMPKVKDG